MKQDSHLYDQWSYGCTGVDIAQAFADEAYTRAPGMGTDAPACGTADSQGAETGKSTHRRPTHSWEMGICQDSVHGGFADSIFPTRGTR